MSGTLSQMPTALSEAAWAFGSEWLHLEDRLARLQLIKDRTKLRAEGLAVDVQSFTPVLLRAERECFKASEEQARRILSGDDALIKSTLERNSGMENVQKEFIACFKAFFFFVRAYQDALLSIIYELTGHESGPRTSMAKLKASSPIYEDLTTHLPQYPPWFNELRRIRNDMKYGVITSPGFEIGPNGTRVYFNTRYIERKATGKVCGIKDELSMQDALLALQMSSDLTKFVRHLSEAVLTRRTEARG